MSQLTGLDPTAVPTARMAFGYPIAPAISEYVVTVPEGIRNKASQTLS